MVLVEEELLTGSLKQRAKQRLQIRCVSFCDAKSMMMNMKGAWLWKGRLVSNRNKPAQRTVVWIRSEKSQEESGKGGRSDTGEHFRAEQL